MSSPLLRRLPEQAQAHSTAAASRLLLSESDSLEPWVIVLLGLPTLICLFLCAKAYLGNRNVPATSAGNTVLVHEGRVFHLSEEQRRTALEIIYANSSQPPAHRSTSTTSGFSSDTTKPNDEADDVKCDIVSAAVGLEDVAAVVNSSSKDVADTESATASYVISQVATIHISDAVDRVKGWIDCVDPANEHDANDNSSAYDIPMEQADTEDCELPVAISERMDYEQAGIQFSNSSGESFSFVWKLPKCTSLESPTSHAAVPENEDDSDSCDENNLCSICLCDYSSNGDIISSKHCPHLFHKECIFEWLQKHDDCPVCRARMVTETDIHQAATVVVGKTRMCRAVASMQTHGSHASMGAHIRSTPPRQATPGMQQQVPNLSLSAKWHGQTIRYL